MDLSTRTGLDKIARDTRQSLALYYNSTTLKEYIMRWSRYEDADKLEERRERTFYVYRNYVREVVQKYLEGLYKRQDSIQRSSPDPDFNKFLNGYYDTWFRREIAPVALLLPEVYVMLVPIDKGFRPAVVFPQYVTNFQLSPNLDLISVDMRIKERQVMRLDAEGVVYYAGNADKEGMVTWGVAEGNEPTAHGLGFCPVVRCAYEENVEILSLEGTPIGHSFLYPVIMEATADLQFRSMLTEAAHGHLFYQMVMGAGTATETLKTGMGSDMPIIETKDEYGHTRYLQKPSFEMSELRQIIHTDMPKEIFEVARLQGRFSNSAQTGAARAADLHPENGVLTNISNYFWEIDDRIVQMLARAMNVKAEVRYPTVFDTRDASDTLRDATTFHAIAKDNPTSERGIREVVKQVQRAMLPGLPAEMLDAIDKETDRAPIPFLQEQKAKLATLPGAPNAGVPGATNPPPSQGALNPGPERLELPPAGPSGAAPEGGQGQGGPGPGSGAPQNAAGGPSGNAGLPNDGQGDRPDALGAGGCHDIDRTVANGMALTFVVNCEAGEEEEEYEQMLEGLQEAGYEVEFINVSNSIDALIAIDPNKRSSGPGIIWNAIEGFHEKAQFEMHAAAFLELAHYQFTGSGPKTLALLQDKAMTKTVLAGVGLAVKPAVLIKRGVDTPDMTGLAWPRMVKPAAEDASEGITAENVTHNDEEMSRVIARLFTITDSILVEEYIEGRELLVGVLGNGKERVVLPPMELEFTGTAKIVTQDAKQKSDSKDFDEVVTKDAVLTDTERVAIEEAVLTATRALEIRDYARVDLRLTAEGVPVIIEINPNPDLSPDHGFGGSAQLAGMTFPQLLDRIVKIARKRYEPRGE